MGRMLWCASVQPSMAVKRGEELEALVWISNDDQIHVTGGRPGVRRPRTMKTSDAEKKLEPTFMLRDASTWVQPAPAS
jgi:hypothetical protein